MWSLISIGGLASRLLGILGFLHPRPYIHSRWPESATSIEAHEQIFLRNAPQVGKGSHDRRPPSNVPHEFLSKFWWNWRIRMETLVWPLSEAPFMPAWPEGCEQDWASFPGLSWKDGVYPSNLPRYRKKILFFRQKVSWFPWKGWGSDWPIPPELMIPLSSWPGQLCFCHLSQEWNMLKHVETMQTGFNSLHHSLGFMTDS